MTAAEHTPDESPWFPFGVDTLLDEDYPFVDVANDLTIGRTEALRAYYLQAGSDYRTEYNDALRLCKTLSMFMRWGVIVEPVDDQKTPVEPRRVAVLYGQATVYRTRDLVPTHMTDPTYGLVRSALSSIARQAGGEHARFSDREIYVRGCLYNVPLPGEKAQQP